MMGESEKEIHTSEGQRRMVDQLTQPSKGLALEGVMEF